MDLLETIKTRRSIRRFKQRPLDKALLRQLLDVARCAPSAANRQPLEYLLITDRRLRQETFKLLAWAAFVRPKRTPSPGHQPTAYIVVLINKNLELPDFGPVDAAAAVENILLAAHARAIGSCWLASVNKEKLRPLLKIPEHLRIHSVIALGYPDEKPVMEDAAENTDHAVKYYLDQGDTLHVPKRRLDWIAHSDTYGRPLQNE